MTSQNAPSIVRMVTNICRGPEETTAFIVGIATWNMGWLSVLTEAGRLREMGVVGRMFTGNPLELAENETLAFKP